MIMIDTIVAQLEYSNIRGILDHLKDHSTTNHGTYQTLKGWYRNLKIEIEISKEKKKLIAIQGSLHKYSKGNNWSNFSFQEIKDSISQIEDDLLIPFSEAELFRVDIGANIHLAEKPHQYLINLDYLDGHKKSVIRNFETVYFRAHNRELAFYDKVREARHPFGKNSNANLLRYEYRFRRAISDQLKYDQIRIHFLKKRKFQKKLVGQWLSEYFNIHQNRDIIFKGEPVIPNIRTFLSQVGIKKNGGLNKTLLLLEDSFKEYEKSSSHKSKVKKWLQKTYTSNTFLTSKLLRELDKKIKKKAQSWPI